MACSGCAASIPPPVVAYTISAAARRRSVGSDGGPHLCNDIKWPMATTTSAAASAVGRCLCRNQMSRRLTYWLISTQADPDTKVALAGVRPSTKNDALRLLDEAYAVAGTEGAGVFRKSATKNLMKNGLWAVVLYKDRHLKADDPRRSAAVVAYYKEWLPPWKRS